MISYSNRALQLEAILKIRNYVTKHLHLSAFICVHLCLSVVKNLFKSLFKEVLSITTLKTLNNNPTPNF